MEQLNLSSWIGRGTQTAGGVSAAQAQQVHAVLGAHHAKAPGIGEKLPLLWHWFAFLPDAPMEELGEDGHPRLGDFMPPLGHKRRMWAGGDLEFIQPLHVGEPLIRETRIADVSEKAGAAGPIVVVALDHEIHGTNGIAILERQNIVYLDIPRSYRPPRTIPAPEVSDIQETVTTSTPLLFRYSAITFNAHRIHYDLPYTQQVEHYPDLVVHGPLQANLIMDQAVRHRGSPPVMFSYRGVHPLFAGDRLSVQSSKTSQTEWALATVANEAHQCMQAKAIWED